VKKRDAERQWDEQIVADFKERGERPSADELVELISAICLYHETYEEGATHAPIRIELLWLIAEHIEDKAKGWAKKHNFAQARDRLRTNAAYQRQAEAIWAKYPGLKRASVARMIDQGNWDSIRKRIRKK
jgi:hypothetical protein